MARGRMLAKSLSTSSKIAALYDASPKLAEFCRVLFPLLLAHTDDHGRLHGDAFTVKMQVDPISPRKLPEFEEALGVLASVRLIDWYQVGDRKIVEIVKFSEHQDLKGHDRRAPKLPPQEANEQALGGNWGGLGESGDSSEGNRREEKGTKPKGREPISSVPDERTQWFEEFRLAYPASRRVGGDIARRAFESALNVPDAPARFVEMVAALEQQKRSEQWQAARMIPLMTTWLNQERWLQSLPESSPMGQSSKTAGNHAALERFVARKMGTA